MSQLSTRTKTRIIMTGDSPFVMDNIRGADPDDPLTIRINELADKGSRMTPEERATKDLLQWRRCLYQDDDGVLTFPYRNLIVAMAEAGAAYKAKTKIIERGAIAPDGVDMTFGYTGPDGADWTGRRLDADALKRLAEDHRYQLRAFVNGNPTAGKRRSMVPRMRPVFSPWKLEATVVVFHDEVGWAEFERIVEAAGRQGLGNARKIGNGRFSVQLEKL